MSSRRYFIYTCSAALCAVGWELLNTNKSRSTEYNPLLLTSDSPIQQIDLTVQDQIRNRNIPVYIYLPKDKKPAPVVLFSHGLGGTRFGSAYLGNHWAARGYVAVFLQHLGSDDSVWKNTPVGQRMAAMKRAASLKNFLLRVQDVPAVLNQLEDWNRSSKHQLEGRLNLSQIGMSGHSFGAVTTQAVSGQSFPGQGTRFTDKRIRAAIMFSPSSPSRGDLAFAFGSVKIPWLLMTGTQDVAPIGNASVASRLKVYPNLRPGSKYELVLYNAEHSAFSDRRLPGDRQVRNPNHHRVILALSTAFWDAYLRQDKVARAWLDGLGAKSVQKPKDRWQFK